MYTGIRPHSVVLGDDAKGPFVIYEPPGLAIGRIIAIHGYGGSWRKTWTADRRTSGSVESCFWLQDLLPKNFPHCQIISIGHDWFTSSNPERGWADLGLLFLETPLDIRAPIFFIAHGLGGVVLKEVIRRISSSDDHTFTPQLDCVKGFMFLGTPHHICDDGRRLRRVYPTEDPPLSYIPNTPSGTSHVQLKEWVEKDNELFRDLVKNKRYSVVSIHEISVQVEHEPTVSKLEATLGCADEVVLGIEGDHSQLSKFTSASDRRYTAICTELTTIILGSSAATTPQITIFPLSGRLRFCSWPAIRHPQFSTPISAISATWEDFRINMDRSKHFWVHFPHNNTAWIPPKIASVKKYLGLQDDREEEARFAGLELLSRDNLPHSRSISPSSYWFGRNCGLDRDKSRDKFIHFDIFLPYLHWDFKEGFALYSSCLSDAHSKRRSTEIPDMPDWIREQLPFFASLWNNDFRTYHPRRSLDQFYYPRLSDTKTRDADQVISKQTEKTSAPGDATMIIVDQLWLWYWHTEPPIESYTTFGQPDDHGSNDRSGSALVTAFPYTGYARGQYRNGQEKLVDIRQATCDHTESNHPQIPTERVIKKMIFIIKQCVTGMLSLRGRSQLGFFELFREAIGFATERQTKFSRDFGTSMRDRKRDSKARRLTSEQKQDEVLLTLELADIIDELNSLKELFETQRAVLTKAATSLSRNEAAHLGVLRTAMDQLANGDLSDYLSQVVRMIKDAARTQKNLLDLLDLQQKEENLYEAQSSNQQTFLTLKQALSAQEQADETRAQSQILVLFTVVTIVFLPLSFFTSYYGMNVSKFTGEEKNQSLGDVWEVMGASSGTITTVLLGAAWFWYHWEKRSARQKTDKNLEEWETKELIPPDLLEAMKEGRDKKISAKAKDEARDSGSLFNRWRGKSRKHPVSTA